MYYIAGERKVKSENHTHFVNPKPPKPNHGKKKKYGKTGESIILE